MTTSSPGFRERVLNRMKRWKVWELDGELRYRPVVASLPNLSGPICEVGSGPRGLAAWSSREVIGVDPGSDERHGDIPAASNFRRVDGDGANVPLPDSSVSAAVAVDTFEHIPRETRAAVVNEMKRVTADGGRVIIIGPAGDAAGRADAKVLARWQARDDWIGVVEWLTEHQCYGLPSVEELVGYVGADRVRATTVIGVFNVRLWWIMHRALLGDYSRTRASFLAQLLLTHPFGVLARRWKRGPFYRYLIVVEIG